MSKFTKKDYDRFTIATLVVLTVCVIVLIGLSSVMPDFLTKIFGVIAIVSLGFNVFCFIKSGSMDK